MGWRKELHTENFLGNFTPNHKSKVQVAYSMQGTFELEVDPQIVLRVGFIHPADNALIFEPESTKKEKFDCLS